MNNTKMAKLKALKTGTGLQYQLNAGFKILGNPILLHDMEYRVIAYTEDITTDDPIWNEFVTTGTVDQNRLEFYKEECFFDTAANATKITLLRSDKLKYDRIYGKIFNNEKIQVGCACVTETHKPFEDDDFELFEQFCVILDKEIAKNKFFSDYGQSYQENLINKLIEEDIEDKESYTAHVESLYINLKSQLYLAVADISGCDMADAGLAYFRDLFKQAQPAAKYSIYNNYIIIIISSDDQTLDIKKDMNKLSRLFKQHNIYTGVSNYFENLFELRKYYIKAVSALEEGLKSGDGQYIFTCDDE